VLNIPSLCVIVGYFVYIVSLHLVLSLKYAPRQIIRIIQQRQHHWIFGHILRRQSLQLDIIEGLIKGRSKRRRRWMQMLLVLAKDGYVALK